MTQARSTPLAGWIFRAALFAAAASLAAYIPYKYATQLHAISGLYAFLFPLSALLAAGGMMAAVRPDKVCDCGVTMRSGIAVLSGLWLATGVMCVGALSESVAADPLHGTLASLHMLTQHVFLSLALIAFASAPERLARALGVQPRTASARLAGSAAL